MAVPTYNCPMSFGAATVLTCTTARAKNTNSGCPFYDTVNEQCLLAQSVIIQGRRAGNPTPTP